MMCAGPTQHRGSLFPFQCFLLGALVFLLSATSSEACGEPPKFETMQLTGQSKPLYEVSEQVHYECKPGYKRNPSFDTSSTCGADSTWSSLSNAACSKKTCPVLPDPVNGQVNVLNGSLEFGTYVEFVCNEGFYLIGKQILRCKLKGLNVVWSGDLPQCEKILCEPPPQIENGKYTPEEKEVFEYYEVATYTCNPNPGSDKFSLIGQSQIHCSGHGQWSSDPPQCKVVKCPYPVIENGRQISGFGSKYYYNAMVTFECLKGFYLHGSDLVVCGRNSAWEPPIPTCSTEASPTNTKQPSNAESATFTTTPITSQKSRPNEGSLTCEDLDEWILALIFITLLELQ
ncbi:membrane cofactor protein-like [Marmota monax]|uniref:Membrane cofactor protein n=1 Tax=Marmota monax TaxID=9995 RepID=A0A834QIY3_MARMO|nr:membrane cofactor protein-like [Marmota monax]